MGLDFVQDILDQFEERAATLEFLEGLPRHAAEDRAWSDLQHHEHWRTARDRWLSVRQGGL